MIHSVIISILKYVNTHFTHYKRILLLFKGFSDPSFALNGEKIKSKPSQFIDYLYLFFVLKILPSNYHLFCFDTKDKTEFKNYVGCSHSDPCTSRKLAPLWKNYILLSDKYLFKVICEYHKLRVPRHYGVFRTSDDNTIQAQLLQLMIKNELENIVLKPRSGHFGEHIKIISRKELNTSVEMEPLNQGEYIVEEHLKQHSKFDAINPHSVNTIRVITIYCPGGKVEILGAMFRTSSNRAAIDNFSSGGIAIGINLITGKLKREGYANFLYSQKALQKIQLPNSFAVEQNLENLKKDNLLLHGRILLKHPVTKKKFSDCQIPYWNDILNITMEAQKIFYHSKSIGWDVAVTPEGPVIIEGNTVWGTIGFQAANGGLLTAKNRELLAQYDIKFKH